MARNTYYYLNTKSKDELIAIIKDLRIKNTELRVKLKRISMLATNISNKRNFMERKS